MCANDGDCRTLLPGQPARCGSDGVCERLTVSDASVSTTCRSSFECQAKLGGPGVCLQGTCRALQNAAVGCDKVLENASSTSNPVIGAFYLGTGTAAINNVTLKYTGSNGFQGELPIAWNASKIPTKVPPVSMILCNELINPAGAVEFLQSAGASVIIGPHRPADLLAASAKALEKQVAMLAPIDERKNLDPGVTAACLPPRVDLAPGAIAAIKSVIERVKIDRGGAPPKVLFASSQSVADSELHDAIYPTLAAGLTDPVVKRFDVSFTEPFSAAVVIGGDIARKAPDIIVINATWAGTELLARIESRWFESGGAPRPVYVVIRDTDGGPSNEASLSPGTPAFTGRTYLVDWSVPPEAEPIRDWIDGAAIVKEAVLSNKTTLTSSFLQRMTDCSFSAYAAASAAVVLNDGADPRAIRRDVLRTALDKVSVASATNWQLYPEKIGDGLSLLLGKTNTQIVGATGFLRWNTEGKRVGMTGVSLSCLNMNARPNGWKVAKTFGIEGGGVVDAVTCP